MRQRVLIPVLLTAALAAAVTAHAQVASPRTRPERPAKSLFGGGYGKTSQQLMLGVSFAAGFDDDLLAASDGGSLGLPNTAPRSGSFSQAGLALDYGISRDRLSASLNAASNARYYPGLQAPTIGAYSFGAQASFKLTSRTDVSTSHQFAIQPNTQNILNAIPFTGSTQPESADPLTYAISRNSYQSFRSAVDLGQELTRRLSLSLGYQYYRTDSIQIDRPQYTGQSGHAGLSFSIARGLGLRFGYSVAASRNQIAGSGRYAGRSFDGGIDFNRAISLTRRTSLTFSTGATGLQDQNGQTRYFLTGNANLTREIGRSWTANVSFRRGANFFQTLGQPVLSDTVSAGISGGIGRRVSVSASTGYAQGSVGISSSPSRYTTLTGGVGLQVGLTRLLGLGLNYGYYHYLFRDLSSAAATLPSDVAPEMSRQSVQLSLNLRVPLLTRSRRPNASR